MSDSEPLSSNDTDHSDSDLGRLSISRINNDSDNQQPPSTIFVGQSTNFWEDPNKMEGKSEVSDSPRSAHQPSNQGCHVNLEEAGPDKGGKVLETPNLTPRYTYPLRNTPPSFLSQHPTPNRCGWVMGRGRGGRTRLEEAKISTQLKKSVSLHFEAAQNCTIGLIDIGLGLG